MAIKKKGYLTLLSFVTLITALAASLLLSSLYSPKASIPEINKLRVNIEIRNTNRSLTARTSDISFESIHDIISEVRQRGKTPEALLIRGFLLIEKPGAYQFVLHCNAPSRLSVGGHSIAPAGTKTASKALLAAGLHELIINLLPQKNLRNFNLLWRRLGENEWEKIPAENLYSPAAVDLPSEIIQKSKYQARKVQLLYNLGYASIYICLLALLLLVIVLYKNRFYQMIRARLASPASENSIRSSFRNRFVEIDTAKGIAGLLMIIAHLDWFNLLPVGTFGAPLFFLCSGMNTILFIEKVKSAKGFIWYQLFFIFLLFFGGYSQIAIMQPNYAPLMPEFLQMSALSILLITGLSKITRNPIHIGGLFFIPFLLHLGFKHHLLSFFHTNSPVRTFFFGQHNFPLFPWSGYFLYGILLLHLRRRLNILITVTFITAMSSVLTIYIFKIPLTKTNMSLSYMSLSFLVITALFTLCILLAKISTQPLIRSFQNLFSLLGRNSLMFLFIHYLATFYLPFTISYVPEVLNLMVQTAAAFTLTLFLIMVYEKLKHDYFLFFPAIFTISWFVVLRYIFPSPVFKDFRLWDIIIGLLFAFLYVQLRRILRIFLKKVKIDSLTVNN